jgi:hypothetical protein
VFESVDGVNQVAHTMESGTLSSPAFGPVGLQLCGLVCILECAVEVFERGVGA